MNLPVTQHLFAQSASSVHVSFAILVALKYVGSVHPPKTGKPRVFAPHFRMGAQHTEQFPGPETILESQYVSATAVGEYSVAGLQRDLHLGATLQHEAALQEGWRKAPETPAKQVWASWGALPCRSPRESVHSEAV